MVNKIMGCCCLIKFLICCCSEGSQHLVNVGTPGNQFAQGILFFGTNDLMMNIFGQTGNAASQLGEKGAYEIMEPQLKKLAAKHVSSGVADAHFEVRHPFF